MSRVPLPHRAQQLTSQGTFRRWLRTGLQGLIAVGCMGAGLLAGDPVLKRLQQQTQAVANARSTSVVAVTRRLTVAGEQSSGEPVAAGLLLRNSQNELCVLTTSHAIELALGGRFRSDLPVEKWPTIPVQFGQNQTANAEVLAIDSRFDLAALRLTEASTAELKPFEFASEVPDQGSLAVVVGNPFPVVRSGQAASALASLSAVTQNGWNGSVLNDERDLGPADLGPVWEIDTRVTGGFDGGAVCDLDGRLTGITTGRVLLSGSDLQATWARPLMGAFASPVQQLLNGEEVRLGFSGLQVDLRDGAVNVTQVAKGSGADAAGLKAGDIIVAVQSHLVRDVTDFERRFWFTEPGGNVPVTVRRSMPRGAAVERTVQIVAGRWAVRSSEWLIARKPAPVMWHGLGLDDATARLDSLPEGRWGRAPDGLLIRVVPQQLADQIKPGEFLTGVNGQSIRTLKQLPGPGTTGSSEVQLEINGRRTIRFQPAEP